MPSVAANGITIHYDVQGSGEPLVLIPFLGADNSCCAFQVAVFDGCAHALISENPVRFNRTTLEFLSRHG